MSVNIVVRRLRTADLRESIGSALFDSKRYGKGAYRLAHLSPLQLEWSEEPSSGGLRKFSSSFLCVELSCGQS